MIRIKQITQIFLIAIFLSSCKTSIKKEYPLNNMDENTNENTNSAKKEWK